MNTQINVSKELYCDFLLLAAQHNFSVSHLTDLSDNCPAYDTYTRDLDLFTPFPEYVQQMTEKNIDYLILDDTVLDKWYNREMDMVYRHYSGTHHRVVDGIDVINLL